MAVKRIPNDLQCLLSASSRVNNFKQAIEELVYNSLDAESTSIAIRVHIEKKWIQVVDNGVGIQKADFRLLGERYATSKLLDMNSLKAIPSKYGYRGQALANIIEVSQSVKVTSRCESSDETWLKTFFEGKKQDCLEIAKRPSKGTTVEINSFLFNQNIQRQSINALSELNDVKMLLVSLSLVFNNVSFSLRDDSESEIIFKVHKNRDIYQSFKSLLDIDTTDIKELQVEKSEYKVKAYIGMKENEIKKHQWIYLNNKLMSNCNLHKLTNDFFSKIQRLVNIKKVKAKTIYSEEDCSKFQTVPMYFIFLSCPYYDYDIVYSVKQNMVEFKDWNQIKKLIEKLVKFYNGDHLNIMDIQISKNKNNVVENVNTKDEVKKIMEKILGNHNKKTKINKMQHGIKGKQIKRKNQKKQENQKNLLNKTVRLIPPCLADDNKVLSETATNNYEKNKPANSRTKCTDKTKNKISKHSKHKTKCKCNKNFNHLTNFFQTNTNTIEKRCKELSSCIKYLTKNSRHDANNNLSIIQITNRITNTEKNHSKSRTILKKPDICINNSKKIPDLQEVRSYDLLQTILKTQLSFDDRGLVKENTQRSDIEASCTSDNNFEAKFTYNSHKYLKKNFLLKTIKPRKTIFLSKQSKENVISYNIDGLPKLITAKNNNLQCRIKKKKNKVIHNNLFNRYKPNSSDTPYLIDVSGSDITEFSKMVRNQIINDMNLLSDKIINQKNQSQAQYTEKNNFGINYESTYTIILDSYQNPTQIGNNQENCKTYIDQTFTRGTYTKMSYYDIKSNANESEMKINIENNAYSRNNFNIVFVSEPKSTSHAYPSIEPLDICEAVMQPPNSFKSKSNKLNDNSTKDSVLTLIKTNTDEISYSNIFSPFFHTNVSRNKTECQEKSHFAIKTPNLRLNINTKGEDQKVQNRNIEMLSNSVNAFNLRSRQRFMPKGMSPIFRNCFSKNICSYNMNTEYYEDIIYNNFVEDVISNTEIFEAKVQNIKELASKPIQKATVNVKQNNSDLIFDKESLTSAKILGQVDYKFIAAKIFGKSHTHRSSEFFVLFDQHAIHERIRLENNLLHYFNGNNWKNVTIDAISLKVSKEENLYLHNHKDKFRQLGLEWTTLSNCEILVHAIPEAIMGKNPRSVNILDFCVQFLLDHHDERFLKKVEMIFKSVKNLISELVHTMKYLKGNVSLYPQSVMNLVFSEACRYAIKFGDLLSNKDCIELIAALSNCKTPFQCAHGRPVMAVMMELKDDSSKYKVNIQDVMRFRNRVKSNQVPKVSKQ